MNTRHSLTGDMEKSWIPISLLCFFFCCVILASVAVFVTALALAGPDLNLRFLHRLFGRSSKTAFIQDRQPHGNGIGG